MPVNFVWRVVLGACLMLVSNHCQKSSESSNETSTARTKGIRVGLVLDKGGKDDKSFNAAAFRGAGDAAKEFALELKVIESADDAAFEPALRTFAERGYELVVAVGFAQVDPVRKMSAKFPNTHFAIVDGMVDAPNTASLLFAEHEGSFLAGYVAGLATKSGKVGFIGGMDVALIRRFETAYRAGVRAAKPKAELIVNYVGINGSAWANPVRGKELALNQFARGVDIIFQAAGASGLGVFDAAEEKDRLVIGVDSNQNGLKPGHVLTSMLKRVDSAVYATIRDQVQNKFSPGRHDFGLKNNGVELAIDTYNEKLMLPFRAELNEMRRKVIQGEVKVPDFYVK